MKKIHDLAILSTEVDNNLDIMSHRCSMGERSGELAGQGRKATWQSQGNLLVAVAGSGLSLSNCV